MDVLSEQKPSLTVYRSLYILDDACIPREIVCGNSRLSVFSHMYEPKIASEMLNFLDHRRALSGSNFRKGWIFVGRKFNISESLRIRSETYIELSGDN